MVSLRSVIAVAPVILSSAVVGTPAIERKAEPVMLRCGRYSLGYRPGQGVELGAGPTVLVRASRIMLRGGKPQKSFYDAGNAKPQLVTEQDERHVAVVLSEPEQESGDNPFTYRLRLELTADGVFTYSLSGKAGNIEPAGLQEDLMLDGAAFAGADFVAGGPGGQVVGHVPEKPRPLDDRWFLRSDVRRYSFRTRHGPIELEAAQPAQLVDFRPADWVKVRGVLLYMSRPMKTGQNVVTKLTMRLPPERQPVEPKSLSLAGTAIPIVDIPSVAAGQDEPMSFWALDPVAALPHAIWGRHGLGTTLGLGEGDAPPAEMVRWVQGLPFRTGGGCILLHGWLDTEGRLPTAVTDLPIGRRAESLCFLHGCSSLADADVPAVRYVVGYEDGSRAEIAVAFGKDIDSVLSRSDAGPPRAVVCVTDDGAMLSAFLYRWRNPEPAKRIATLSVHSVMGAHSPVLFAVTGVWNGQ